MANLLHIKGSRTKVLNTFPTNTFGKEGDIVISRISGKGVFLCTKAGGMWYVANKMQELRKYEDISISNLKTNSLSINKLINADNNTNQILVNDFGLIKYRTNKEIIDDLNIFESINYKTAHCSLGQYTDKESCEAGGGTWYYSENDSHDNISSTAENQLLTVGESIGNLDAEPTLLYDSSTLEIKYNSDYDDNWQTSAQTDLLKLSYGTKSTAFNLAAGGDFTIDCSNDIILDAVTNIYFQQGATTNRAKFTFPVGASQLLMYNPLDSGDFFQISTIAHGKTTISTTDNAAAAAHLVLDADGDIILDPNSGITKFYRGGDDDDLCTLTVGGDGTTTIATADSDGTNGHLTLAPDGDLVLDPASQKTIINATDGLYFDGGGDTYIYEASADNVRHIVGGDILLELFEYGADGNTTYFKDTCAGFTQLEPTYDATNTLVDFRHSNKQNLTFGSGSITNLNFYFPLVSGNFVLLIKQDGTGSRTITNYRVYEFDESSADGVNSVVWAGGSAPTLTTDANHVDILSFYWDADNEIAYGVATLDFQF
jgi:hypothetical protein